MAYSYAQLEALWISQGGNPAAAPTAAAIALAESGGNPNASGDGGDSCGLWQIDTAFHPNYTCAWLQDPTNNAKAAIAISGNGANWTPWSTYCARGNGVNCQGPGQGAYRHYLSGAPNPNTENSPGSALGWLNAGAEALFPPLAGVESAIAGGINGVENFAQSFFDGWVSPFLRLPQSLINIGWNLGGFCIGLALCALGILLLFGSIFEDAARDIVGALNNIGGQSNSGGGVAATAVPATTTAEEAAII